MARSSKQRKPRKADTETPGAPNQIETPDALADELMNKVVLPKLLDEFFPECAAGMKSNENMPTENISDSSLSKKIPE